MDYQEALCTICSLNMEFEAIKYFLSVIECQTEDLIHKTNEQSACLQIIRKINDRNNKAIDVLCEPEIKEKTK